jgi:NAD(P)-dependent dehydrogenase (short-subunit alcohol dehydrogenase family)
VKLNACTGGAQGIGAATVSTLYRAGGHVVCGDWNEDAAREYNNALNAVDGTGSIQFVKIDIGKYESQLELFDAAIKTHGRVDIAICCAAVGEQAGWFEPESLDLESVRTVSLLRPSGNGFTTPNMLCMTAGALRRAALLFFCQRY